MSQTSLAHRSGVPQAHIARPESGKLDARLSTLRRLFDAMFCDLLVVPRPRKRPSDALAEQELERPRLRTPWD
jgi:transcriptional regulator with XRE-family HTH domain